MQCPVYLHHVFISSELCRSIFFFVLGRYHRSHFQCIIIFWSNFSSKRRYNHLTHSFNYLKSFLVQLLIQTNSSSGWNFFLFRHDPIIMLFDADNPSWYPCAKLFVIYSMELYENGIIFYTFPGNKDDIWYYPVNTNCKFRTNQASCGTSIFATHLILSNEIFSIFTLNWQILLVFNCKSTSTM